MSERERFEAWMSDDGKWPRAIERDSKGEYLLAKAASDWTVWQAALARSGQAASGSSQGARSDEAVKRFGIKPWSTLARLKDDEDLELYVRARIEAEGVGVGQPEAPTAAPLVPEVMTYPELSTDPDGDVALDWSSPVGMLSISISPLGRLTYAWRLEDGGKGNGSADVGWGPFAVLKPLTAHPPARSGAGSEEGQG